MKSRVRSVRLSFLSVGSANAFSIQSSSSIPDMPRAGNHFASASALETTCSNASRAYMGLNMSATIDASLRGLTLRCGRHTKPALGHKSCKFAIRGEQTKSGRWVVDGSKSEFHHNHGRHPSILADPEWRPARPHMPAADETEARNVTSLPVTALAVSGAHSTFVPGCSI